MKKVIPILLAAVMLLTVFAACGDPPPPPQGAGTTRPADGGQVAQPAPGQIQAAPEEGANVASEITLVLDNNNIAVLNMFNPASGTNTTNMAFTMIFDRLLNTDMQGNFLPGLAYDWSSSDYQTFNFKLRDDVYFHNGEQMTSACVAWTIRQAQEATGGMARDQWAPVDRVNVIGPYEIELVLRSVNVDFYFNVSMPMAGIVNEKAMRDDPEGGVMIGTGAFMVEEFVSNDYTKLRRFDRWWNNSINGGEREIPTEVVTLIFIPELPVRAIMLENGEAQGCLGPGPEDVSRFQNNPDWEVYPLTFNNPQNMIFGSLHPITSDYNFRMAILHAIDREEIGIVAAGEWVRADTQGTLWGLQTQFRNNDLPIWPYDLDLARQYLEDSVWNGETIEIIAAITTNVRGAEQFQQQMQVLGVNVVVREVDPATLAAMTNTPNADLQMGFLNTMVSMNAGSMRPAFIPGGSQNRGFYDNPEVTELLDRAAVTTDDAAREALYMEVQRIFHENPSAFNIYWRIQPYLFAKGMGGMRIFSDHHHNDLRGIFWDLDA